MNVSISPQYCFKDCSLRCIVTRGSATWIIIALSSPPSSRLRRLFLVCSHESARQQGYEVCKGRRISLIRLKKKKNARREPFQIHHHLKKVSDPPPASRTFTEISANVWKEDPSTPKRSVCLQSRLSLFCRIKTASIILSFFLFFLLQLDTMRNARLRGLVVHHNLLLCAESMSAWFVFSTDNLKKSRFVLN